MMEGQSKITARQLAEHGINDWDELFSNVCSGCIFENICKRAEEINRRALDILNRLAIKLSSQVSAMENLRLILRETGKEIPS
ncbi:MAG: hypothetical protein ABIE43_00145 [Patescibacteria group bacterium]